MTNHRFSSVLRQHRARGLGIAMLFVVIAGLSLAPIATASADSTGTDATTQPTDVTAPDTTAPSSPDPSPTTTEPAATAPAAPATPETTTPAADDDAVPADVEARAPHHGDNNEDGIADADQANVASLPASVDVDHDGTLDDYVTIVSPAGTTLHDVHAVAVPSDTPPPDGVALPYGLFDYDVQVATPGDAAAVTYITPSGFVPSGVHFLQNGVWSDLADRTDVDAATGDVTVQLQDGGAGDAGPAADAVIADPSGPSTRDRSITAKVVSGAGAPTFTLKLESCTNAGIGGSCTGTPVPTSQGSNDALGQSAALANGGAWNWGGTGSTQLAGLVRYRLSVVTSLPASGWVLTGTSCNGVNQQNQSASLANAQNIYLQNNTDARADCTFTFAQPVTSITVHKKGDRSGASVTNLADATFQAYSNSTYTTPVAGASCTTDATGACPITGLSPSTTYYVRETTAPASFQRIDTLTTSSGGSQVYGQAITTGASGSNVDSRNFANRRVNPAFPNECGINIGLVMDLSNSISDAELLQMKTSAKAFVTALQGTPSSVGGYTFATEAPAGGNSDLGLTSVSGVAGADTARTWIDNRTKPGGGGGGTNWDAGLRQVVAGAGNYDVVVFLTDGNPTFYGDPQSGGTGSDTTFREIEEGVFSVNAVKAANANLKMVGVAIGSDASTDNIAAISGPIPDDDYYLAANFVDLQNKLQQIASQLCGGTVTVKKQVEGPSGFSPAGGWNFTVPGSQQGTGVTAAGTGVTPAFDVTPGAVTITETQQPGYGIVPTAGNNATCTKNGTAIPANQITNTANGISLNVGALDIVACEFRNTPTKGTIQVKKQTLGTAGGPFTFTLTGPGTNATYNNVNTAAASTPVTAGTASNLFPGQYVATETGLPGGWTLDSIDCPGATVDVANKKATITVPATGGTTVCTFTNKSTTGTIELKKTWSGALTGDAPTTSLQIGTGSSGAAASNVANQSVTGPSVGTTTAKTVANGTYFVQEAGLASGWLQTALTCSTNGGGAVTYVPASGVAVPAGGAVVCTVTNTRQKGTVELKKVWSGGAAGATPQATLQIGTGSSGGAASNVASKAVTGLATDTTGTKDVGIGTYFVSETGLSAGWSQSALTCSVDGGASSTYVPANGIAVANGKAVVCTATNTRDTGSIQLDKKWTGALGGDAPSVHLQIGSGSGGSDVADQSVTGPADGSTTAKLVPTGTYFVQENGLPAGWLQTSLTCSTNGGGAATYVPADGISVPKSGAVVCTVTNTRQKGTVELKKVWSGGLAGETPQTTLQIGTGGSGGAASNVASKVVTGLSTDTTGTKNVGIGTYFVSESGLAPGWGQTGLTCQSGTKPAFTYDPQAGFPIANGESVVCTLTNTRNIATVTVKKTWIGGAAGETPTVALNIVGPSASTTTVTGLAAGTTGPKTVVTGTYSASETSLTAGWTQTDASCVRDGAGSSFGPSNFTVGPGEAIVCTFTNTRQTGTVRVDKTWVGGAAGEQPTADLKIVGPSASSTTVTGPAGGTTTAKTVVTGTYSATETSLAAGWTQTAASCVRNGTGASFGPSSFIVDPTDHVVCTITNTRDTGTLRIDKVWAGGGVDDAPKVNLDINGPSSSSSPVTGIAPGSTGTKPVATGTYTVGESGLGAGWDQAAISCVNGTQPPFIPGVQGFVVAKGDNVVCTITNAKRGKITIVKDAVPNAARDFGFSTSGLGAPFALDDDGDGTLANTKVFTGLVAGTYSVTEDANPTGWSLTDVACVGTGGSGDVATRTATINLAAGGDVTCTFTNRGPDVGIVKTDTPDPVTAGADLTYSLAVTNSGPPVAAPVQVSDPLPAGTTFVSLSAGAGWTCTTPAVGGNGTVSCTLTNLAVGAAPSITVVVRVGAGVAPGTDVIVNTAKVTTPNDTNPANDESTAKTSVVRSVDLEITKSDGGATPTAGGAGFQYTVSVDNLGPSDASADATVTDVVPAGISFASFGSLPGGVSCTPPAVGSQTFSCTVPKAMLEVSDGAVAIPVNVTVPATTVPGSFTNKVIVSSVDDVAPCTVTATDITCDPADTNNYAQVTTPVSAKADLAIVKTAPATGIAGNDVSYTLAVSNLGPSSSVDVVVDDTLPAGLSFVSASGSGWSCSESPAGNVHCTRPKLAVGAAPAITVVAHVAPDVTGKVTNCATVADTVPGDANDTSCDDTTISAKSDLAIVKTAPATGVAGTNVSYSLAVTNLGPSNAADVVVNDPLPADLSLVSAIGTGWDCSTSTSATVHCTRPMLAVGAAPAITVVAHVAPDAVGTVTNCATVVDTFSPDTNDESCGVTTVTPEVDVSIVKTDTPDPVVAGENLTYSLAVANGGPSNATDVEVSDPLPANTTFVSLSAGAGWSCTTPAVGANGTVSCSLASLAVGSAPSIAVVVRVGAGVAPGVDVIENTAAVTSPHDSDPSNNTSTAKTSVVRVLDLKVTKSDGGATPVAGDGDFTYTITVDNLGPSDAGVAATVTDTLPAGVSFVAFGTLPEGVSCTPPVAGAFTCTVDASLLQVADPAVVLTLDVTVPASTPAGTLTNTVVVTTPEEPCPGSPNCGNNTDHTDTPVTTKVDLGIRKSDGGATPTAGNGAFVYTITVDNEGPSDASAAASVTDVMPTGVDFVSYGTLPAGVSCEPPDGRTLECTIAQGLLTVASPGVVIPVNVTVPATTPVSALTNKVIVSNPDDPAPCTVTDTDITCDPSDTNNYAEVTTPVVQIDPAVVTPTTPAVQVEAAALAFTGSDGGRLALLGAALVAAGALFVLVARRRRSGRATG